MYKYQFDQDTKQLCISDNKMDFTNKGYDLIEEIGNGRNGIVLKGQDCTLKRTVAIKFWLPYRENETSPDPNKFYNEIQKIAKLDSDKIVKIYHADIIDNAYFYAVYEFVQGETLKQWLKKGQSFWSRCSILKQVYHEMKNVHKMGIYHGDLHDRNILINQNDKIKIIDFGTSFFSNIERSHQRETDLLLKTGLSLLEQENEKYNILENEILKKSPPECVPCSMLRLRNVIEDLKSLDGTLEDDVTLDDHSKKQIMFSLATDVCESPFFNLDNVFHFIQNSAIEDTYIELFIGCVISTCKDNINGLYDGTIKKISSSSENIENMKSIYCEWRNKYLQNLNI